MRSKGIWLFKATETLRELACLLLCSCGFRWQEQALGMSVLGALYIGEDRATSSASAQVRVRLS